MRPKSCPAIGARHFPDPLTNRRIDTCIALRLALVGLRWLAGSLSASAPDWANEDFVGAVRVVEELHEEERALCDLALVEIASRPA